MIWGGDRRIRIHILFEYYGWYLDAQTIGHQLG
jgi:hypothetical protein